VEAAMPRRPGRPRSMQARTAIVTAAGELMLEGGLTAATIQAIAARAGVSKATVYKWWSSPAEVALEGLLDQVKESMVTPPEAPVAEALELIAVKLIRLMRDTPCGPILRAVAARIDHDPVLEDAFRRQWLVPRRAAVTEILSRGIDRGEVRADIDMELTLDMIFATIYYRLLVTRAPMSDDLASPLVAAAMASVRPEQV